MLVLHNLLILLFIVVILIVNIWYIIRRSRLYTMDFGDSRRPLPPLSRCQGDRCIPLLSTKIQRGSLVTLYFLTRYCIISICRTDLEMVQDIVFGKKSLNRGIW